MEVAYQIATTLERMLPAHFIVPWARSTWPLARERQWAAGLPFSIIREGGECAHLRPLHLGGTRRAYMELFLFLPVERGFEC